jgi:hypothetical protein
MWETILDPRHKLQKETETWMQEEAGRQGTRNKREIRGRGKIEGGLSSFTLFHVSLCLQSVSLFSISISTSLFLCESLTL